MPQQDNLQQALSDTSEKLDRVIDDLLPSQAQVANKVISLHSREQDDDSEEALDSGEAKVMEAMRYAALGGGKRLRPFLTVECAKLFGVNPEPAMLTAAALVLPSPYNTDSLTRKKSIRDLLLPF